MSYQMYCHNDDIVTVHGGRTTSMLLLFLKGRRLTRKKLKCVIYEIYVRLGWKIDIVLQFFFLSVIFFSEMSMVEICMKLCL